MQEPHSPGTSPAARTPRPDEGVVDAADAVESAGAPGTGMLQRAFAILRALAGMQQDGVRVTHLAKAVGLTQGTAHRILQSLIAEGMVEQDEQSKLYRLSVDFFALAAQAGNPSSMRTLCRPALLRLCASLGETIFLLVKSGFDAVCLDLCEGPFPIRSFTGDIGGRIALGVGQGSLAILAFLPEAEREEVIRFNVPRIRGYGVLDGMAGVAVPILDRTGYPVGALSVGTLASRLGDDRMPMVVELLRRQADAIGPRTNPFDAALRRPMHGLSGKTV
ncbi:TPA: IclR family transcriptional regulator [Burkholderia cenocepacia]